MLQPGSEINGRYIIHSLIGEGGMGAVYRAQDTLKERPVAIKEFRVDQLPSSTELMGDEQTRLRRGTGPTREHALEQFKREAQMMCKMHHPNLPEVDDFFILEERGYIVMTLILGRNLLQLLEERPPLPEEAVRTWLVQILSALAYCHSLEVYHRDLKPENILLTDSQQIFIIDFGIAKSRSLTGESTMLGAMGVTAGYAPPEQYAGKIPTDARFDIYALGATLFHLLTGQQPPESVARLAGDPLQPPRQLNPAISLEMEGFIQACMSLERSRRPDSAVQIQQIIQGWGPFQASSIIYPDAPPSPSTIQDKEDITILYAPGRLKKPDHRGITRTAMTAINPQQMTQWRVIKALGGPVNDLAFSAAGFTLASSTHLENRVRLWSVDTGECIETLEGFQTPVNCLAFSPTGRRLAAAEEHSIQIVDLERRTASWKLQEHPILTVDMAFSPEGSLLACVDGDNRVRIYQLNQPDRPPIHLDGLIKHNYGRAVAFSPDGHHLAVGLNWNDIFVFSTDSWKSIHKLNGDRSISIGALAYSPDGKNLAVGNCERVMIFESRNCQLVRVIEKHRGDVSSLAFSPDGTILASGGWDHTLRLNDPLTGREYNVFFGHEREITCLSFSADGSLLASGSKDGTIRLWANRVS